VGLEAGIIAAHRGGAVRRRGVVGGGCWGKGYGDARGGCGISGFCKALLVVVGMSCDTCFRMSKLSAWGVVFG
jgi:hypothetical protein